MSVDPEQLEKEADELFAQAQQKPEDDKQEPQAADTPPEQADAEPDHAEEVRKLKESYKHAHAKVTQATQESAELRRQLAVLTEEIEQIRSERIAPREPDKVDTPITNLRQLETEYPELMRPLLAAFEHQQMELTRLGQLVGNVHQNVEQTQEHVRMRDESMATDKHQAAILAVHPDAYEVSQSEEFQSWVSQQPPVMQRIVQSGSSQDVIWLISQYKATTQKPSKLDEARRSTVPNTPRARQQPTQTQPRFTRAQIAAMSAEEFAKREAEIDQAIVNGWITG